MGKEGLSVIFYHPWGHSGLESMNVNITKKYDNRSECHGREEGRRDR